MPLPTGMERPQKGEHLIYPWGMSATGSFDREDLGILRREKPKALAEALWPGGKEVRNLVLAEMIGHGVPRKAAEVARALITGHSEQAALIKKQLEEAFENDVVRMLLKQKLSSIPGSPKDFPPGTVTYIQ